MCVLCDVSSCLYGVFVARCFYDFCHTDLRPWLALLQSSSRQVAGIRTTGTNVLENFLIKTRHCLMGAMCVWKRSSLHTVCCVGGISFSGSSRLFSIMYIITPLSNNNKNNNWNKQRLFQGSGGVVPCFVWSCLVECEWIVWYSYFIIWGYLVFCH